MNYKQGTEDKTRIFDLFRHTDIAIVVSDSSGQRVDLANPAFARMHGCGVDEIVGMEIATLFPEDVRHAVQKHAQLSNEYGHHNFESEHLRRDGTRFPVQIELTTVRSEAGEFLYRAAFVHDISARRRHEQFLVKMADDVSLKTGQAFYEALVNFIAEELGMEFVFIGEIHGTDIATIALHADGGIVDNITYALDGTPCENVAGREPCFYPDDVQRRFPADRLLVQMGARSYTGVPVFASDGSPLGIIVALSRRPMHEDESTRFRALMRIFSGRVAFEMERAQNEDRMRRSIREKEVLIKEVHHRVKNNMAMIASLLKLQANCAPSPETACALFESRNRIYSMALVHEKLYETRDFSRLRLSEYLESLLRDIRLSHGSGIGLLRTTVSVGEVSLDLDRLIPLGLIINEMVTNSLKHAFMGVPEPALIIEARQDGGMLRLSVADNGCGLPESVDPDSTATLGMQLITNLSRQIGASIEISRAGGTKYTLGIRYGQ